MRTAVVLLGALALAAVPGSLLPQRNVASDPRAVPRFFAEYPELAPVLDRLSLFNVYGSAWFAAIYLLLLVSMTGCVLPRCLRLWRECLASPAPGPRHLRREPFYTVYPSSPSPDRALTRAATILRRQRYRVRMVGGEVAAEKGYLREVGNLAFHLSLLVLLVGMASGRLLGFEGRVAIAEGGSFTNVQSQYDAFTPSAWTDVDGLEPLSLTLESFEAEFETSPAKFGEPRAFDARVSYRSDDDTGTVSVKPNQPLNIDQTKFFLTGHGYAPEVTVRDGRGQVTFSGPVIFLPSDPTFTSNGVVKAPDARPVGLGFEGVFVPTAATSDGGPVSAFPGLLDPRLVLSAFSGDLGMNDGSTQSVYTLEKDGLDPVLDTDGSPLSRSLSIGETLNLPGGKGSLTFDGVSRFANFQIAYDPGKEIVLVASLLLLAGLTVSLTVSRRRVWIRVVEPTDPDARTSGAAIEIAMRSLSRRDPPLDDMQRVVDALRKHPDPPPTTPPSRPTLADTTQEHDR